MKVAFDIDDTLGDTFTPSLAFFNKKYSKDFTEDTLRAHLVSLQYQYEREPFAVAYGLTEEAVRCDFKSSAGDMFPYCRPFEKALEVAKKYMDEGYEIYYITARDDCWHDVTLTWLEQNGFPTGTLIHERDDKAGVAEALGVKIFYEDNLRNAVAIHQKGIKTYLINAATNYHDLPEGMERLEWAK